MQTTERQMDTVCERQARKGKKTDYREIQTDPTETQTHRLGGALRGLMQRLQAEQRPWESPKAMPIHSAPSPASWPPGGGSSPDCPRGRGPPSAHWLAPTSPSIFLSPHQDGGLMPAASQISTASTTQLATTCANSTASAGTTSRAPATRCGPLA